MKIIIFVTFIQQIYTVKNIRQELFSLPNIIIN